MDKLERYLDQVCRGIAGPRMLRKHIRQELREHLLDAAAGHRAAGLSEEEALARALDDFGGPEQVRSELEATHGHRVMALVIDKALQWKERTMKAKWLWMSWAHLSVAGVIAAQVLFLVSAQVFIVPKHRQFLQEGWLDGDSRDAREVVSWAQAFLGGVGEAMSSWVWWVMPLAAVWAIFEWRVQGENKPFLRLSALGTVALALMAPVVLTAVALVLPITLALPALQARAPEAIVKFQAARLDTAVAGMERAIAEKDWQAIENHTSQAVPAAESLARTGAAAPALLALPEQSRVEELRVQLKRASESLREARQAVWNKDAAMLEAAMQRFQEAYKQLRPTMTPAR